MRISFSSLYWDEVVGDGEHARFQQLPFRQPWTHREGPGAEAGTMGGGGGGGKGTRGRLEPGITSLPRSGDVHHWRAEHRRYATWVDAHEAFASSRGPSVIGRLAGGRLRVKRPALGGGGRRAAGGEQAFSTRGPGGWDSGRWPRAPGTALTVHGRAGTTAAV